MGILPFLNKGVTQVAIIVSNLESSVEGYWKSFEIGPWHFYTYGKPLVKEMSYYGKPANYEIRIALSNMGSTRIELIEVLKGDSIYRDFINEHGYGLHHLGVLVDDMKESLHLAKKHGFKMIQDGAGFGVDGDGHFAYLDTYDILGVTYELIERPKRRFPPEKIFP
jgi:hypothetical protein